MSPARRRQQFVPSRPRSEIVVAAAVGAGIVLGTALLVWLMRPGKRGFPNEGGLLNRQPRITLLVLLAAAVAGLVVWFVVRRTKPLRLGTRGTIGVGVGGVVVLAVVGGILWPGGVIRHWPKLPSAIPEPTSLPSSTAPSTTAKPGTSVSSTTKPSGTTTAPAATTSTPTTKGG